MMEQGQLGELIRQVAYSLFLISILLEILWAKRQPNIYSFKESVSNVIIFSGAQFLRSFVILWQALVLSYVSSMALFELPSNIFTLIIAVILVDFLYYWQHRLMHQVKLLWCIHHLHHSSPWMNFTTAFRLHWLGGFIAPVFYIPAALLGFDLRYILLFFFLNLIYQFFLHTQSINTLPKLEGILNTPSAHRVHHGSNSLYIDKNYGGIFMIWDRLLGTYQAETEAVKYGVTTGFIGHNPLTCMFKPIVDYIRGEFIVERDHTKKG